MLGLGLSLSLGSQRRVSGGTPTPTPTPSPAITFNGTTFSNSLSTAGQWQSNGANISGQTGATYTYVEATDHSTIITQVVGAETSNGILIGRNNLDYSNDWEGSRVGLQTLSGWAQAGGSTGNIVRSGTGLLAQVDNAGFGTWYHSASGPHMEMEATISLPATPASGSSDRQWQILRSDANNHIDFNFSSSAGNVYTVVAGSGTKVDEFVIPSLVDGGTIRAKIMLGAGSSKYLQLYHNGVRFDSPGGVGIDVSAMTLGSQFGFTDTANHDSGVPSGDINLQSDFLVNVYPTTGVSIYDVSFGSPDPTSGSLYPTARVKGVYSSSTSNIYISIVDASGNVLQTWSTPEAVSGNAFDITIPLSSIAAQGTTARFVAADTANHANADIFTVAVPYIKPAYDTLWGTQLQNTHNWSEEAYVFSDLGKLASWAARKADNARVYLPNTDTYFRPDGKPTGVLPPDCVALECYFLDAARPGYEQGGDYTITWSMPGFSTVTWHTNENCVGGTINTTTKTAAVTGLVEGAPVRVNLLFTPDTPGVVTGGMSCTMRRNNETSTGPISDKAMNDLREGELFRFMKWQGVEDPYPFSSVSSTGLREYPHATPEELGLAVAQTGVIPHFCSPVNATPEWALDWATRLKTTIPSGTTMVFEFVNELGPMDFNSSSYLSNFAHALSQACSLGYVSGVSAGTYLNYMSQAYVDVANGTGVTYVDIPAGTKFTTMVNYQFKCLENISGSTVFAGYPLPNQATGEDDGVFATLAVREQLLPGKDVWRIDQLITLGTIVKDALAGWCTVLLGHGSFIATTVADEVTLLLQGGTGTEKAREISLVMPSGYADMNIKYSDNPPDWLTGYSDQATFDIGYDAFARDAIDDAVDKLHAWNNALYSGLRTGGIPDELCADLWLYELNLHMVISDIVSEVDQAGVAAAVQSYYESPAMETLFTDYLAALDGIGVKGAVMFSMHQPFRVASGQEFFGLQTRVNTANDPVQGPKEKRNIAFNALLTAKGL